MTAKMFDLFHDRFEVASSNPMVDIFDSNHSNAGLVQGGIEEKGEKGADRLER